MKRNIGVDYWVFVLAVQYLLLFNSCNHKSVSNNREKVCKKINSLQLKYAKGFAVDYYDGFNVITTRDLKDTTKILGTYVLLPEGKPAPVGFENAVLLPGPIGKVVCVSTNHIGEMIRLGLRNKIAGVTNVPLIYDSVIENKVQNGAILNLGEQELNYEKLVELSPDFVFTSGSYDGGNKMKTKLDALHVKLVLNLDYMEQDPLARAEWIKFVAAFFDDEHDADSIFNSIEHNYKLVKAMATGEEHKPTVFLNMPFKEIWYMPCGENYMAKLVEDAGGDFLWKDTKATNGLNLNLDYEAVYNKAADADYWLNVNFANSLPDVKAADAKNVFFKAYKTGHIFNNNLRNTPAGGFDFWESGVVNPDLILLDLAYIFHPDLFKDGHTFYYYKKLK